MGSWGGYELSRRLAATMRDRKIIIDRTCARCDCEYEWGVHVAFFGDQVGLTNEQISSITHGKASDQCWSSERDRLLIEASDTLHDDALHDDALHDDAHLDDDLWNRLHHQFSDEQLLDPMMPGGWYHSISDAANGARVERELGAPRFTDVTPHPDRQ